MQPARQKVCAIMSPRRATHSGRWWLAMITRNDSALLGWAWVHYRHADAW
jgi:hypothetical protein